MCLFLISNDKLRARAEEKQNLLLQEMLQQPGNASPETQIEEQPPPGSSVLPLWKRPASLLPSFQSRAGIPIRKDTEENPPGPKPLQTSYRQAIPNSQCKKIATDHSKSIPIISSSLFVRREPCRRTRSMDEGFILESMTVTATSPVRLVFK